MRRSLALLICGGLFLSACQQQLTASVPETATPTQARQALGFYELTFNTGALGKKDTGASIQRVGLSAQAQEISGLTFEFSNMTNVIDVQKRVNHMTATFKVTNRSGRDISVPIYLPIIVEGSRPTDSQTPFRNVRTRKDVPVSAQGMKVEQSHQTSGGVVQPDPKATPFVNNLDPRFIGLNLPAGDKGTGSFSGWKAGALPNGASQLITFAAQVPLQQTDITDADPFKFNLVFAVLDSLPTVTPLNGYGWYPQAKVTASAEELEVLRVTNEYRTKGATCTENGVTTAYPPVPALTWNDKLAYAARNHALDMLGRDYFEHASPEGISPWQRMMDAGYTTPFAENIAAGYPTARDVVDNWMTSDTGHCSNIMNKYATMLGVGLVRGNGSYGSYWVQDFGR